MHRSSISRIKDLINKHVSHFLIDANIFPGNSGDPVLLKPELVAIDGTKPHKAAPLIGIVKGYIPYKDIAISQ